MKTAKECIDLLIAGKDVGLLMLDHDLGGEIYVDTNYSNTGSEVVRWIEINKPRIKEIIVHSYNHSAGTMMTETLVSCGYDAKRIPFDPSWVLQNYDKIRR